MEESIPERVSQGRVITFSFRLNSSFCFHLRLVLSGGSGVARVNFKAEPTTRFSAMGETMFWVYGFSCPGLQGPGRVLGGRKPQYAGQLGVRCQYSCSPMTWFKCSSTLSSNYSEEIHLVDWVEVRKKKEKNHAERWLFSGTADLHRKSKLLCTVLVVNELARPPQM